MAPRAALFTPAFLLAAGCFTEESTTPLVHNSPFGSPSIQPPPMARSSYAPPNEEMARRVAMTGQKIVAANPALGLRPMFRTVGSPQPEVFHRGTSEIVVTEGLVRLCTSEGQLAAVLCMELGKMVVEREALVPVESRRPDRGPPIQVPVGTDAGGFQGGADQTRLAELARYEGERRRPTAVGDATTLARSYLAAAGYRETDLAAAQPALRTAGTNYALAKQLTAAPPIAIQTPPPPLAPVSATAPAALPQGATSPAVIPSSAWRPARS